MLLIFILYFPRVAWSETESIHFEYTAEPSCPSEQEFLTLVLERTDAVRVSDSSTGVRTFVVKLRGNRGDVTGSLMIREPDGSSVARTFQGDYCAEVAMALALATALAIDPSAPFAPRRETEDHEAFEPVEPAIDGTLPPVVSGPGSVGRWEWEAAGGPALTTSLSRVLGVGGTVGMRRVLSASGPVWGYGLAAIGASTLSRRVNGATSEVQVLALEPHVCALGFSLSGSVSGLPCVGVELGVIRGVGHGLPGQRDEARFWSAANAGFGLRFELDQNWHMGAGVKLVVPMRRYRFFFDNPDTTVHRVPSLAGSLGLTLGWTL